MPNDIFQELEQVKLILRQHQHSGTDFTVPLRGLDLQQVAKLELTAANTSLSVAVPLKRFYRVILEIGAKSAGSDDYLRFNSDSGSNYTFIDAGVAARTSQAQIDLRDGLNSALGFFATIDIINYPSGAVKSMHAHVTNRVTAASTAQSFHQIFGTWVNTTQFINTISLSSSGAATYPSTSTLIVLSSRE